MTRATDTWLELHVGLGQHPKILRLQAALDLSRPAAVGHMVLLWSWAMTYAPDGSLRRFGDDEIARAAQYDVHAGVPAAFVGALVDAGWIDRRTRRLHDWGLYAGRLLDARARNVQRMREYRARKVQAVNGATEPNRTEPITTPQPPAQRGAVGKQNPRALGANPRALGTNPRGPEPPYPHPPRFTGRCEECGFAVGHDETCSRVTA